MHRPRKPAFTLIELLVVVAIIALLISILLPSLSKAREQARAATCGTLLKGFGNGFEVYYSENDDWIPGHNTTGVAVWRAWSQNNPGALRQPNLPVQFFDWMTPIVRQDGDLVGTRAERFLQLMNRYRCPSQATVDSIIWDGSTAVDMADFNDNQLLERWTGISYLMPNMFQFWGQQDRVPLATAPNGIPFLARAGSASWEVTIEKYRSKRSKVGVPGRKLAVADGTRFLDQFDVLDHDVSLSPTTANGSFVSSGGWWCGDESYGVRQGSTNWDGETVNGGAGSPTAGGRGMALSYRHNSPTEVPSDCHSNRGSMNALFFDGHIERLSDRKSREITFWYPTGARVEISGRGMTRAPVGFEIP